MLARKYSTYKFIQNYIRVPRTSFLAFYGCLHNKKESYKVEVFSRVKKTMFYSLAELVRKILFTTLKICSFIFLCNILASMYSKTSIQCFFGQDPKVANVLFALPKIATRLDALLLQRSPTLSPYVFLVVRKGEIKKIGNPSSLCSVLFFPLSSRLSIFRQEALR